MTFSKSLAKYYHGWFRDCHDSAIYCETEGDTARAAEYLNNAREYLNIIMENWDAIEFFSINDNAFLLDSALPVEFRGYE